MKYREILKKYQDYAIDNNKEDSAIIKLLIHFSKLDTSSLYMNINDEMAEEDFLLFKNAVISYVDDNIPVQHLTGYEYFYGHKFIVNENVLIPRFETEELVANVLMIYDEVFVDEKVNVVDIGTGSGCLGITLDLEEGNMNVIATDISEEALTTAKLNSENLGSGVCFLCGDMLEPLRDMKFDIIVSNPPYIPNKENVDSLVKDNEPHIALFGGDDGLKFYRIILEGAKKILNEQFIIAFEHAFDKGEEITELCKYYFPEAEVRLLKDMQNKNRMTFVIKK